MRGGGGGGGRGKGAGRGGNVKQAIHHSTVNSSWKTVARGMVFQLFQSGMPLNQRVLSFKKSIRLVFQNNKTFQIRYCRTYCVFFIQKYLR